MINVYDEDEFDEIEDEIEAFDDGFEDDLGPGQADMDLMDGSWEEAYYSGSLRQRDWRAIGVGLSLLVLIALTVPLVLTVVR